MHLLIRFFFLTTILAFQALPCKEINLSQDGWIESQAKLTLYQPSEFSAFVLRGIIPQLSDRPFYTTISIQAGQDTLDSQKLSAGAFEIRGFFRSTPGPTDFLVTFSHQQTLPAPDGRLVGGRLLSATLYSLQPGSTSWAAHPEHADIIQPGGPLALGQGWGPMESYQNTSFRWLAQEAYFATVPNSPCTVTIDCEPGPSLAEKVCMVRVLDRNGQLLDKVTVTARGNYDILIPKLSADRLPVTLQLPSGATPVANDGRILSLRVFGITVRPE